jgi:hypothetical protein
MPCASKALGPSVTRRLTRAQIDLTVRDLLGDVPGLPLAANRLRADLKEGPFDVNGGAVTEVNVEEYLALAEEIAAVAVKDLARLVPCTAKELGTDACAGKFAVQLGARALRRPLDKADTDALERLYLAGKVRAGFPSGIEVMLRWLLQAPEFLYQLAARADTTAAPVAGTSMVPLGGFELAARLSYFLWSSMPDEALFASAAAGRLATREGLRAEAIRMLTHDKGSMGIGVFHQQWLGADRVAAVAKDPSVFPLFTPALAGAMQAETRSFSDFVIRRGDGKLESLLTAPYTVMPEALRALYGAGPSRSVAGAALTDLDPTRRAGLLTQAAFLTVEAHRDQTSPVKRGAFIKEHVLCQDLLPPPANVNNAPPELRQGASTRERFAQHSADPKCAGCHRLIDPLGLALETFDGIGAFRTADAGRPIDPSGELVGTDVDGTVTGAPELARRLARSQLASSCVVKQWFRYALGRADVAEDACALQTIGADFERSGLNLRELILSLVTSDAFRFSRRD